ncbi:MULTISPECIES: hypothetical protein [unclassified Amycolatopsis]|uniref:hypothetical protein n=1 Tax=unclassified Amycolatopsis TaxID=2618356 RepID=UPI00106E4A81|nr:MULTISPECIES: hypothetical protein [unclassified Amycolatopsis]
MDHRQDATGSTAHRVRSVLGAVVLAGLTFATWWSWLGSDTTYQVDPVTGNRTGPYEPWQVAGCVLCLVVLAVAGTMIRLHRWVVVVVMSVVFTVAWSGAAISADRSGMWGVGALMVAIGMVAGSYAVVSGAENARTALARRQR